MVAILTFLLQFQVIDLNSGTTVGQDNGRGGQVESSENAKADTAGPSGAGSDSSDSDSSDNGRGGQVESSESAKAETAGPSGAGSGSSDSDSSDNGSGSRGPDPTGTDSDPAEAPDSTPKITLSRKAVSVCEKLTVKGRGFDAADEISLEVSGLEVGRAVTTKSGHFTEIVVVPYELGHWPSPRREVVFATGGRSSMATAQFTIPSDVPAGEFPPPAEPCPND